MIYEEDALIDQPLVSLPDPQHTTSDEGAKAAVKAALAGDAVRPRGLSQLQLNTWRQCQLRWAFAYRLRPPIQPELDPETPSYMDLGTAGHQLLECAARARIAGHETHPKAGRKELSRYVQHLAPLWKPLHVKAVERMIPRLSPFDLSNVWIAEHPAQVKLGDHPDSPVVALKFDRVDRLEGGAHLQIVDYKFGQPKDLAAMEAEPQTGLSLLAARELWGPDVHISMRYMFLGEQYAPDVVVQADPEQVEWTRWLAEQIWERMQDREAVHPASPGPACRECPYLTRCRAGSWYLKTLELPTDGQQLVEGFAELLSPEELCAQWLRLKGLEDGIKGMRQHVGALVQNMHLMGLPDGSQADFGRYQPNVARRASSSHRYPLACLPALCQAMRCTPEEALRRTRGLQKPDTEAWAKPVPEAVMVLERWRSTDYYEFLEIKEKKPFAAAAAETNVGDA